ncbi:hypothetical protein D6833_04990 [Candidatus Parcubacteria bacterium]|nr:MAG: hypothetical protein D6833_04990 [Candidatus Parcubacteria bacterium]
MNEVMAEAAHEDVELATVPTPLVVLSDGETWSSAEGCFVAFVDDQKACLDGDFDDIEDEYPDAIERKVSILELLDAWQKLRMMEAE